MEEAEPQRQLGELGGVERVVDALPEGWGQRSRRTENVVGVVQGDVPTVGEVLGAVGIVDQGRRCLVESRLTGE